MTVNIYTTGDYSIVRHGTGREWYIMGNVRKLRVSISDHNLIMGGKNLLREKPGSFYQVVGKKLSLITDFRTLEQIADPVMEIRKELLHNL